MQSVKLSAKYLEPIIAIVIGIFIKELVNWVTPFTNNLVLEYTYIISSFVIVFILLFKLNYRLNRMFQSFLMTVLAILILLGNAFLYFLIGQYESGWLLVYFSAGISAAVFYYHSTNKFAAFIFLSLGFILGHSFPVFYDHQWILFSVLVFVLGFQEINISFKITYIFVLGALFLLKGESNRSNKLVARQTKYADKVIFTDFSRKNKIDVTTWRGNEWYYVNNQNRISTLDDYLYHEPFIHPIMQISNEVKNVLVIGGETGGVIKEISKYEKLSVIDVIPLDYNLLEKFRDHKLLNKIGGKGWKDQRLKFIDQGIFDYLNEGKHKYDAIIIDLPDPINIQFNQYYTTNFYHLVEKNLKADGLFVTQTGSPYFATKAFYSIVKTIKRSGFYVVPYHNQILTLGEWGWVIGSKGNLDKLTLQESKFDEVPTKWINNDAMNLMLSFGKIRVDTASIAVNTIKKPITFQYYQSGNWAF